MNPLTARLEQAGDRLVVRFADAAFPLATYSNAALEAYSGGSVTLGIRPEDVYEAPPAEIETRALNVAARVLGVEPLGAETLLMLAIENSGQDIIARVWRDNGLCVGGDALIALDTAAVHLFDPMTAKAIARLA